MHVGPDPYAKQRRWWPILLRMARQLYWTWWVLAGLGLLSKASPLTRWLERRFIEVEHGLRCLLIIKASSSRRYSPDLGAKSEKIEESETSSPGKPSHDEKSEHLLGPRSEYRRSGFNLTLAGFDERPQQLPPFDPFGATSPASGGREFSGVETVSVFSSPVYGGARSRSADADEKVWETFSRRRTPEGPGEAGDGGTKAHSLISPSDHFAQRLAAIEDVFNDADGYAKRIARRVYSKGWRLIRLIAQQLTDIGFALDPNWPQFQDATPRPIPILDSS